jgi:hypothetical protein
MMEVEQKPYKHQEYPKWLRSVDGSRRLVNDKDEHRAAKAEGFMEIPGGTALEEMKKRGAPRQVAPVNPGTTVKRGAPRQVEPEGDQEEAAE